VLPRAWDWTTPAWRRHPRIVVCDISGYGDGGPHREKAYDLLIQSEAGFVSVTGTPEQPSKAGLSIADIAAGMYAYSSVLAALLERGRTGRGQRLEISMLEAMSEWMGFPLYYTLDGQPPPPRAGASHAAIYPYGPFTCGDGKQVVLAVQHDREWATFCNQVLQLPELTAQYLGNANRLAQREKLRGIIEGVCATPEPAPTGGAARCGANRQRPAQRDGRPVEAPATRGARALDRDRFARRHAAGAVPAAPRPGQRAAAAHGAGACAGPAHRSHPDRARLRRD
jgi:crotonobetainyl-CoA:carnitine CoA-transferase CaiB-like acyl-CoA transferase